MDTYYGQIALFAGAAVPRGWIPCDGRLLPIVGNQALYSLLGTNFGGDGVDTFSTPDFRTRLSPRPAREGTPQQDWTWEPDFFLAAQGIFPSRFPPESGVVPDPGALVGEITMWGCNFVPVGWLPCDGGLHPIASHKDLFSLLGSRHGGDARTTFATPDLRGGAGMAAEGSRGASSPGDVHFLLDLEDPSLKMVLFGGGFVPEGWTPCDGRLLPVDAHPEVFRRIGTRFGGDGTTDFALPDLRGRGVERLSPSPWSFGDVNFAICHAGTYPTRVWLGGRVVTREDIFEIIVRSTREVLPDLDDHAFQPSDSLRNLGGNSIDYSEIVMMTLETLDLRIPLVAVARAENVGDLARILHEEMAARER